MIDAALLFSLFLYLDKIFCTYYFFVTNMLLDKSRYSKCEICPKDNGIEPFNMFSEKSIFLKDDSLPRAAGSEPEREL